MSYRDITEDQARRLVQEFGVVDVSFDDYRNLWWHLSNGCRVHYGASSDWGPDYWWLEAGDAA